MLTRRSDILAEIDRMLGEEAEWNPDFPWDVPTSFWMSGIEQGWKSALTALKKKIEDDGDD